MDHAETSLRERPAQPLSMDEYWMPFTPNRDFRREPKIVVRAEGMYYWSDRGDKIIDASSGLFCVNAGHGRKEIADAVGAQLRELDFAAPFTRGHPKQFEFATRLAKLTPAGLNRIFFTNSGSEAIDSAMKLALAYHQARGQGGRTMFVSRERAYHGVNFGGVSLAGIVNNRRRYGPGLPGIVHMRHTHLPQNHLVKGEGEHGAELADDLARFVNLHGAENIAACFVEPIAGSTGCLVPPKGYLKRLREICDAHGILLVFDEVITGWGRLGTPFAAQYFGVEPDLITFAKGVTSGAVPLGGVIVRDSIYETFTGAQGPGVEFFHGYTYSGHPLACAAGIAALDTYEEEALFKKAAHLARDFENGVHSLKGLPTVVDCRNLGLIGAVELAPRPGAAYGTRAFEAFEKCWDKGVFVRPVGEALAFCPPLIAQKKHLDLMFGVVGEILKEVA